MNRTETKGAEPWTFQASFEEWESAERFMRRHRRIHGQDLSAAGGRFSFTFAPCGIGTAVVVHCAECRKCKNVTDYGAW